MVPLDNAILISSCSPTSVPQTWPRMDGNRTVTQMLWTSVGQIQLSFVQTLLEKASQFFLNLRHAYAVEPDRGRGREERNTPYPCTQRAQGEGLKLQRTGVRICWLPFIIYIYIYTTMKDKMVSVFPCSLFVGLWAQLRLPSRVLRTQVNFPHLPWWLKTTRTEACFQWLAPRPKSRSMARKQV